MEHLTTLIIGVLIGVGLVVVYIQWPDETQWRRHGNGWRRKRHGRWDYTEDRDKMLHR